MSVKLHHDPNFRPAQNEVLNHRHVLMSPELFKWLKLRNYSEDPSFLLIKETGNKVYTVLEDPRVLRNSMFLPESPSAHETFNATVIKPGTYPILQQIVIEIHKLNEDLDLDEVLEKLSEHDFFARPGSAFSVGPAVIRVKNH